MRSVADSIDQLRDRITSDVPPAQRDEALRQVAQLQSAILPQPKVGRMQEVRDWFVKHLPSMLGALTSIFVNPIVGKIVQAAGEMTADAFHKRFGDIAGAGRGSPKLRGPTCYYTSGGTCEHHHA